MKQTASGLKQQISIGIGPVVKQIRDAQRPDGEIPWCDGEKTDPWDHVEAAMGLTTGGCIREAEQAFMWLASTQLEDGSWYSAYKNGVPEDRTREANMAAYIAVGLFHYYLMTRDTGFLKEMWPVLEKAIRFVLRLQAPGGEIYWALDPKGNVDPMALLTGSSSVYMSLKCALAIADLLGRKRPEWVTGMNRLETALRENPHLFNMTKSRYSMDWFYPILSGAVTGEAARRRVDRYWKKFVIDDQGVRCVSDQPWVTIAESAEFCLALSALGSRTQAQIVFGWISDKTYDDGSYWCGYTYPDMTIWPDQHLTWTNGVVLMAADALFGLTPCSRLFSHQFWNRFKKNGCRL